MNQTSTTADALNAAFRRFSNSLSPQLKERMDGRLERGQQIVMTGGVIRYLDPYTPGSQRTFKVRSSNPTNPPYLVDLDARTCTCPDHWKGHYCKHRIAAQVFELADAKTNPIPVAEIVSGKSQNETISPEPQMQERIDSDSLIWACLRLDSHVIGVEVQGIEGSMVRVQALPTVTKDGKLEPQFPFPDGSYCTLVLAQDLFHIRVFRHE